MATRCSGWFTSSFSNGSGTCVEVRFRDDRVDVRDTKDRGGPVLTVSADDWVAFLAGSTTGPLAVEPTADGIVLRADGQAALLFTDAEWHAYRLGVDAGEFDPPSPRLVPAV